MEEDDGYLDSYADLEVHAVMLRDAPRVAAFRAALDASVHGKTVLDVGAGTGLLSLLALRAGASHVYAVEGSALASLLPAVFEANGFAGRATVLACRVEDAVLPARVDVIVSEWLGFHLLHEAMLESVVIARDAWLKPGGLMLPSSARVLAAPVSLDDWAAQRAAVWTSIPGCDLSCFAEAAARQAAAAPQVMLVGEDQLLCPPEEVFGLDCGAVTAAELARRLGREVRFAAAKGGACRGYALWFEASFPNGATVLSTAPGQPPTHWMQSVVLLPEAQVVNAGDRLDARIYLRKDESSPRACVIDLEV